MEANNITDCYIGFQLRDVDCGLVLGNYVENNEVNWYLNAGGIGVCDVEVRGNWFGAATGASVFQNCTDMVFTRNTVSGASFTIGSSVVRLDVGPNKAIFGGSVPSTGKTAVVLASILYTDYALSDVNTAQNMFPSGQDEFTVEADTTYDFDINLAISRTAGTTSHQVQPLLAGTATRDSIGYIHVTEKCGQQHQRHPYQQLGCLGRNGVSQTAANTSANEFVVSRITGTIRFTSAGTFIPQIKYTAAPGGVPTVVANSRMRMTPPGSRTMTTVGRVS